MTPPPLPTRPKDSGLSTCSLVFGILGLVTGGLFSIPAVVTGHIATKQIKQSQGAISGGGRALAGLITGYLGLVIMPILILAGFTAGRAAMNKARDVTAKSAATSLQTAVDQFYTEHSGMPSTEGTTDTALDVSLVKTLTGLDRTLNPRGINFLSLPVTPSKKNGYNLSTHQVFDPWGNGYIVIMDVTSRDTVTVTRGSMTETLTKGRVVVYSRGADGIPGTDDDIITW